MFPEIHYYRIYILSVSNVLKSIQDGFLHGRKKRGIREMEYKVGVISGDGIGPEIVTEAKKVLDQIGKTYGHEFHYEEILMGGCSIDATGEPLTDAAIASAKARSTKPAEIVRTSRMTTCFSHVEYIVSRTT